MTQVVETIERITTESAAARGAIVGTLIGFFVVGGIALAMALNAGKQDEDLAEALAARAGRP